MTLAITFHRAASAEFIEASVWYESKRLGLALEFMAEIDRCILSSLPLFARMFDVSSSIAFRTAFIFVRRNFALLSWLYSMAAEIPQFGGIEPSPAFL